MLAEYLCLDIYRRNIKPTAQMHPKAQSVEKGAGAENAIMPGQMTRQIGERIGRIGHDKQHSIRSCGDDPRHYVAVDRNILVKEAQPPLRIAAIGRPSGLLIDPD